MYAYKSNVFWCTPDGRVGLRHCDNRFATTALCGTSEAPVGRACNTFERIDQYFFLDRQMILTLSRRPRKEI